MITTKDGREVEYWKAAEDAEDDFVGLSAETIDEAVEEWKENHEDDEDWEERIAELSKDPLATIEVCGFAKVNRTVLKPENIVDDILERMYDNNQVECDYEDYLKYPEIIAAAQNLCEVMNRNLRDYYECVYTWDAYVNKDNKDLEDK